MLLCDVNYTDVEKLKEYKYLEGNDLHCYFPKGYKRITKKVFEHDFFTLVPDKFGYTEVYLGRNPNRQKALVYFYSDYALAIVYKYENYGKYSKKYYRLGCIHNWKVIKEDTIEIEFECEKCKTRIIQLTGR